MENIFKKLLDLWNLSQDVEVWKAEVDEINKLNDLINEDEDSDDKNN